MSVLAQFPNYCQLPILPRPERKRVSPPPRRLLVGYKVDARCVVTAVWCEVRR
jgi:hypothetical protein